MYTNVFYCKDEKCFLIDDIFKLPYVLDVDENEIDPRRYEIYGFLNRFGTVENQIYKIIEKDSELFIGYLMPMISMLSSDHDCVNQKFFLIFASNCFIKLIKEDAGIKGINDEIIEIEKKYNDNLILLIIDKSRICNIDNFDIKNYFMCLYKYGYYLVDSVDDFKSYKETVNEKIKLPEKNLKIQSVCKYFKEEEYIFRLPQKLNTDNYVLKFFYLYQVVEIIIEKILKRELRKFGENYNEALSGYEISKEVHTIASEDERINRLFSDEYKIGDFSKLNLKNECNNLIESLQIPKYPSASSALYAVRNNLVHNLRVISNEHYEHLKGIVDAFEDFIHDILYSYKEAE
ncbi:hypothetical protein SAMN05660649_03127 [Desulfotomaculum arcticum]|uniref:Apea-like HEPN domain-containing protein n=1 Tax=Desulfotruncus arcticus DSM 17038 TaxID=1121424 RepID=A0A1I2VXQ8_9FIRM|nr:hypothetical protein [Desulfotruncus arcticus]SFG92091.1 hypothetical protein SAMN05660649_03127 [Desulfotomaculum arcticum] [Desulfotruncus arcticus DSM 17038]